MSRGAFPSRAVAASAALLFALFAVHVAWYAFLTDDAFISFRYAKNLSEGHGLVFNAGHERVEGYTNFLWVLVLAALARLGIPPEWIANKFLALCGAAVWLLVLRASFAARDEGEARRPAWVLLAPVLLLSANRSFSLWCTSGLETKLFELLVVAGLLTSCREVAAARAGRPERWTVSSLLLGLACLTRPDGAVIAAGTVAARWVIERRRGAARLAALLRGPGLIALLVAAHLAFRLAYYGDWVPNTYHAKVGGKTWWPMGWRYALAFAIEYGLPFWLPLLAAAAHGARRGGPAAVRFVILGAPLLPYTLYLIAIGGDHFEYRPLDLVFPIVFLLLADGAALLAAKGRRAGALAAAGIAGALAVSVVVALLGRLAFPTDYRAGFPGATARDELTSDLVPRARFPLVFRVPLLGPALDAYNALISEMTLHGVGLRQEEHRLFLQKAREEGTFLAELVERGVLRPDTHIAIGSVGAIPYYSGLRTMDRLGLTDRAIARGPERAPGARIMAHSKVASIEYAIEQGIDLWASDHTFLVVKPHDPRMSDFAAKAVELGVPLVAAPATPRGILLALAPSWKTDGGSRLPAFADAAAFYRKLTSLPNSPWWASSALGDLLAARGDVAGATAAYQRALGLDSTIVRAEHRLGKLLLSAGDLETGIRHLSRAHSLDPRNQRVRVDLADALALAARYGEALALLQDGVRANPASIDMWTTLARFYAGCPDPAVRDSKRAVIIAERMRSETYDQDPNVLDALAAAYAAAGRFGDARAVALEASRVARRLGSDALADEIDRKAALYARNEPMFERSLPEAASE